ncbi:hypothetical protein [Mycobacterium arosiense]|uniref:hypothetical protein n=1 Tax=Mycobacterium arosiense TaxID=425468 RepID=UPI0011518688|nr:hypothetical protein [Mycobacterium arosiense]
MTQIAVSANLLEGDELIYARVHAELSNNPSRVIVLGDKEIRGFENRLHVATYVPTAVGRVFKAHAMCAAGINADSLPPNEVFRRLASNAPVASSGVPRDDKASESQTVVRMPRGATP